MFNNIGEKIKKVAKILFWIEAVIFVLAAFVYAGQALQDTSSFIVFLLVLVIGTVLGILISYVSVIITYGFGELISLTKWNNEILESVKKDSEDNTETNI